MISRLGVALWTIDLFLSGFVWLDLEVIIRLGKKTSSSSIIPFETNLYIFENYSLN